MTFQADFRLGCRGGFPTDLYDRLCGTWSRGGRITFTMPTGKNVFLFSFKEHFEDFENL